MLAVNCIDPAPSRYFPFPPQCELPPLLDMLQSGLEFQVNDGRFVLQQALELLDFSRPDFQDACSKAK